MPLRRALVVAVHLALWSLALAAAFLARFDGDVPALWLRRGISVLPLLLLIRTATFWRAGLFHGFLRYAGMRDVRSIVQAATIGSVFLAPAGLLVRGLALPRSVYLLEWGVSIAFAAGLRFAVRTLVERGLRPEPSAVTSVVLLGAGDGGELFLRDLGRHPAATMRVAAILDDDETKQNYLLHGVRVVGPIDGPTLRRVVGDTGATRVVLAIPTVPGTRTREIVHLCRELGVELKAIPSMRQIADGNVNVSRLRDVAIEDLLRRDPVVIDATQVASALGAKRVLVTGAAGTIGSELARQIARLGPSELVLFDHSENGLFFLERELRAAHAGLALRTVVGSIRDERRVRGVFAVEHVDVVYHAAAHKHVPMMEANPAEAVANNVLGTRVVADAAGAFGADAFVLISTDKAVNPTSIMGSCKRVAEMYVQALGERHATHFVAVRFGNVLGSAGSVVPIFRAQIEAGGPVTVTDPNMRRYFMTVPEACQLVLQASVLGKGGEIFLLDMGHAVKILDLARDMITLSGFRPDVDITIEVTGVRPGEKLFEELLLDRESATSTAHGKIWAAKLSAHPLAEMTAVVERLIAATPPGSTLEDVRAELARIVPEARFAGADADARQSRPSGAGADRALGQANRDRSIPR